MKKIVSVLLAMVFFGSTASAFKTAECNSSQYFWELSCDLCFDWWNVNVWQNVWILQDTIVNTTPYKVMVDISEQKTPFMENLQKWLVEWSQIKEDDKLWSYSSEASKYLNKEWTSFIFPTWASTVLTRSSFWWSYVLDKNKSDFDEIGMVVFPIVMRNLDSDGTKWEPYEHRQCVLYKGKKSDKIVEKKPENPKPEKVTDLPVKEKTVDEVIEKEPNKEVSVEDVDPTTIPTGAEHILILMLSLILISLFFIKRRA